MSGRILNLLVLAIVLVAGGAVALVVARAFDAHGSFKDPAPVVTVSADAAAYRQVIAGIGKMHAEEQGRVSHVLRVLEGVKKLRPGVRTVYDTIVDSITVPVLRDVVISNGGELFADWLLPRGDSTGYRPARDSAISFANCDERLSIANGSIVCDPARLGHIGLFAEVGLEKEDIPASAAIGLQWRPSYRSADQVAVWLENPWSSERKLHVAVRKGVWLCKRKVFC